MRPHRYVGRQGPNLPRNMQREDLVWKIQCETEVEIDPESNMSDGDGYTEKISSTLIY